MPIPHLTTKNSHQNWRKRSLTQRAIGAVSNIGGNHRPTFTGRKPKGDWKKFIRPAITVGIVLFVIGTIGMLGLFAWAAKDLPDPNRIIDRSVALSTKIYDRTGETVLYEIHGAENRTLIELKDIPQYLIDATIVTEDRRFYEHGGFSLTGIIRSVIKNVFTGSKVGGSTLTQQLVKNAILTNEKSYTRKAKELILSYQIEKKFSKDQILQLYFNEIPYGSTAYGAESAAQTYFGKSVKAISLAEAAVLAALPQAPSRYSPYGSNVDILIGRQQFILREMAKLGYITEEEAENAIAEKVVFKDRLESITAPHFVMYVKELLTEKYGELAVEQGGLKVITTLDTYKQKLAEEAIEEITPKNIERYDANNAALVAVDPKTGQILAMVGSRDYFNDEIDGQVNVALRPRQPGSSFKPIVYTAAFRKGFTPETVLYDVNTRFVNTDGAIYEPKNYDLAEHGPVTMRTALAGSLNIPAVKTLYLTGMNNVLNLAEELGYTTLGDRSRFGLSLVLGGGEVKLLEHVNAFAVFAREGEFHPTSAIMEVKDKDGNLLEEFKEEEKKVLETQAARQINSVLSDNGARAYIFGAQNFLNLGERPVAAKTGTTNDYKDAWTVGYTPSIAVGVWVGNSSGKEMKRGADGSVVAAPIWHTFMSRLLQGTPIESFNAPAPTTSDKPVLNGSIAGGVKVKIDSTTNKLATELTPASKIIEKTFINAHSILYYINPDDPQGNSEPKRSGQQYENWEAGVADWVKRQSESGEISAEAPPTEYDDVHTIENQPSVNITSPSNNQTLTDPQVTITANAQARRGIQRIEYYLNDVLIGVATGQPFSLATHLSLGQQTGDATLKAIAYDDVDNAGSDEIRVTLNIQGAPNLLTWQSPSSNQTLTGNNFPLELKATLQDGSAVQKIDVYYYRSGLGSIHIATAQQFINNQLSPTWFNAPPAGEYQLFAVITTNNNQSYSSTPINITVQ